MKKIVFGFVFNLLIYTSGECEDIALRLDGTNYIRIPISNSLPNNFFSSNTWTLELRLKSEEAFIGREVFMGLWHKPRLVLYGNTLVLAGFINSQYTKLAEVATAIVPENWNHIVCLSNGTNYKIFIDGTERGTFTYTRIDEGAERFLLCSDSESFSRNFVGLMDDVRIYSKALSVSEISNNYTNKEQPVTTGLVSWWKFDGNTGDFMNNNNGQIVGSAIWANLDEPAAPPPPPEEGDAILAGDLLMDTPTIHCLGFRWFITGDDNGNGKVEVSFRKKGEEGWRDALPMLRVNREVVYRNVRKFLCGNLFGGSILNLEENTEYEVKFQLYDPDGGQEERIMTGKTKSTPKWFDTGQTGHVYPPDFTGTKTEPNFSSLAEAAKIAKPGDVVLLHKGIYPGPFSFSVSGLEDKPIVFCAAGDGEVIIDGQNTTGSVIEANNGKNYLFFENLTIRNGKYGITAHSSNSLVVRNCKIEDVNFGILTSTLDTSNWYIANNILTGRYSNWYPRYPNNYNDEGINIIGTGHIICYNRISKFGDGICTSDMDQLGFVSQPGLATMPYPSQTAIDIYDNFISESMDDGIETDFVMHNVRVWGNRIMNCNVGLSAQPCLGGPIYWWRNLIYNVTYSPLKLHNYPSGLFILNNTCIGAYKGFDSEEGWQNVTLRNNLFLGAREYYTLETGSPHPLTSLDYNGYRRTGFPSGFLKWTKDEGKTWVRAKSIEEFFLLTGHEEHGTETSFDDFVKAPPPIEGQTYLASDIDLRLKKDAKVIDRGVILPTITDGFTGKAPDLGALEITNLLTLKKSVDKKYVLSGGTITYTITYTNSGNSTATDVVIIEVLPENCGLRISDCESKDVKINYWYNDAWQTKFNDEATKIRWQILEVAPASFGTVSFIVEVK